MDLARLRSALPQTPIHWLPTVDTTMRVAAELANQGAPAWTVAIADEQTAGIGRYGRRWHSTPEDGLYMTWILKPDVDVRSLPAVTLAIGIALVDAAAALTGVQPDLRWPNDLLIREKKCAGILVQAQTGAVLAGIGVNLNHEGFPHEIAHLATSWRAESGRRFEREDVLIALEPRLREALALLETRGVSAVIEEFTRRSSYAQGKRVAVDQDGSTLTGTTAGLDDNGFLRLRQENGHETLILAGGVRPL